MYTVKPEEEDYIHDTHCIIIFVAVDKNNTPIPVPPFTPETEEEEKMQQYAMKLMELRTNIEDEMQSYIS